MEQKAGGDKQIRLKRKLLSRLAAVLPASTDETALSRRNELLSNLFKELKPHFASLMAASTASTTVPSLSQAMPSTLQSEPTVRPSDQQSARRPQCAALPGWGFMKTTQSDHRKASPKRSLRMNFPQESCSCPPISHKGLSEASYCVIPSIRVCNQGTFLVPSDVAFECADGSVWSRAQRILRWQRQERFASRLPTQSKRELCGIRRVVYPNQLCRLMKVSFRRTPTTEKRDAGSERQGPAPEIEWGMHNGHLSGNKLSLGVPQATCEMLDERTYELLENRWDTAQEVLPELMCHSIKMTSGTSVMPYQPVYVPEQGTKSFEPESSLQPTENCVEKCADPSPNPQPLGDYNPTSKTSFSREVPSFERYSGHDFCFPSTPSLMNGTDSVEEPNAEKSGWVTSWLPPPMVTQADNHAVHRSLRIGEQNVHYAKPPKREVMHLYQNVADDNKLFRGTSPLTYFIDCSAVTEFVEWAKMSKNTERSQQDVSIAVDNNGFFQDKAASKGIVVSENAVAPIAQNMKLKLVPPSSQQKREGHSSVKSTNLGAKTVHSHEKKAPNNKAAPSQEQRLPIEDSSAQNELTPPVRENEPENEPENDVELSKEKCTLMERSPAQINLCKSIERPVKIKASGKKAARTKKKRAPNKMSARTSLPHVTQMAFENGEMFSETGNISNSIAAGCANARMTLTVATTATEQSFPVRLSELNQVVCSDSTELIQKAHAAECLEVGRWQKVLHTNEKYIGNDLKSECVMMKSRLSTEVVLWRSKPEPQGNDCLPDGTVKEWFPCSTSPHDQELSETQGYHKPRERKEIEESTIGGTLPIHDLNIPAVNRKPSRAAEKCQRNNQDTSQAIWQREGWVDFPNDTLEENSEKSCSLDEPNNWQWDLGEQELEPREIPVLFPSSNSVSASWEVRCRHCSILQAQACNHQCNANLCKSDYRSSPPWAPYSDRHATTSKSYGSQDHLSQPSTEGTLWNMERSQQSSPNCQSLFSYSDRLSFLGPEKRTSAYSRKLAFKVRDTNSLYLPSRPRNSPPQFSYTCQCPTRGLNAFEVEDTNCLYPPSRPCNSPPQFFYTSQCPTRGSNAFEVKDTNCLYQPSCPCNSPPQFSYMSQCPTRGSNEVRDPFSESERRNTPYGTVNRMPESWKNLPVSRH
nr:uncharacterized protein LOC129387921 [Dermacentor andersoni]XP_054933660.1 uncharacterized protein LOC129387921 [Dermacentor andersoni]